MNAQRMTVVDDEVKMAPEIRQTPYQIFRSSTAVIAEDGSARFDGDGSNICEGNDGDNDVSVDGSGIGDDVGNYTAQDSPGDKGGYDSLTKKNSGVGFLSPNSIEIRRNAKKLLMQQPRNKKKDRRRMSLPLLPISSNILSDQSSGKIRKPVQRPRVVEQNDLKEELEADLEDIKNAARHIADKAVIAGEGAFEALSSGAKNMSNGAKTVFGQLW
ncbi:hypothetical protein ACHAWF_002887 [Thalassiosira exigua]